MILPDATLAVLGGGQLGRMFTIAARTMGYRVVALDPDPLSPAGSVANEHLQRDYRDPDALEYLGRTCAAVTTEFENVPADALRTLEGRCPVRPGAAAVELVQDRIREKTFIRDCGLATASFRTVREAGELDAAVAGVRLPAILKTAALGYDGKGQRPVADAGQAHSAFAELGSTPCVLEERVDLALELSVVLVRSVDGELACYPPAENRHVNGILDTSIVPARVAEAVSDKAVAMARTLAENLDYCGVLAVEFFLSRSGELLVNELAPRPHNSGHYTLDACLTTQFEQQVRMMCGLPPGETRLLSPVVMVNLLGDLWGEQAPPWGELFRHPNAKLHLYGKHHARPGRKMGHYNVAAPDAGQALELAERIRAALGGRRP
ncbi:MAG TPA: 5-(carboxyamino)imidazole ribonucleotide synthase [Gammaproteobacteria bacterium]|nr:5-(carboxyamino)imidazole ribonucleotide synthase [Gammaproteobacteria bacterium]